MVTLSFYSVNITDIYTRTFIKYTAKNNVIYYWPSLVYCHYLALIRFTINSLSLIIKIRSGLYYLLSIEMILTFPDSHN